MKTIGENIKVYRLRNNWTQDDLAKLIKTNTKYISVLERGIRIPSPSLIEKLCDAFGINEITLRFGERKENIEKPMELLLVEQELAGLSPSELLEVCLLIRKKKEDDKLKLLL